MSRRKASIPHERAHKKTRSQPTEEDQPHPMARWFITPKELETYVKVFENRAIITPRYVTYEYIESRQFVRLRQILDFQRIGEFVGFKDDYYPNLMGAALCTLNFSGDDSRTYISLRLGNIYDIDMHTLAEIWGMDMDGARLRSGGGPDDSWGTYSRDIGLQALGINRQVSSKEKVSVHEIPTEYRLLHYLIVYTLLPRRHNHGVLQNDDILIMWALLNGKKICWPLVIIYHMLKMKTNKESIGLGYGPAWTKVFKHLELDLDEEKKVVVTSQCMVDDSTLKHMRRGVDQPQGRDEVQDELDRAEAEAHAHDLPSPPPEPPITLETIYHQLREMDLRYSGHFDIIHDEFRQMSQRLDRVEQHMGIHRAETSTQPPDEPQG